MKWDAWVYSARRAWQQPLLKWTTVLTAVIIFATSVFFLGKIIPARQQSGTLVFHYNIYLGIDQVHPWGWIFLLPGLWILFSFVDIILAYGFYHHDPHFAWSLIFLAFFSALPCAVTFFYLAHMNL